MNPVVITSQGKNVWFAWSALSVADENGDNVDSYIVSILDRTNMIFKTTPLCDGNDATNKINLYCEIKMVDILS